MKCTPFLNLAPSTPMALMNIFPNSICLCLSKADIDSVFNSYLIPYLFHIYLFVFVVVFCIFVLIYSVTWFTFFVYNYTLFWLNPSAWFICCHMIAFIFLVQV
jgi:hypothetical protein